MKCRLHENEEFSEVPDGAVEFGYGRRKGTTYRFPDGTFHQLYNPINMSKNLSDLGRQLRRHNKWHVDRNLKREGCIYCYPELLPAQATDIANAPAPQPGESVGPTIPPRETTPAIPLDFTQTANEVLEQEPISSAAKLAFAFRRKT